MTLSAQQTNNGQNHYFAVTAITGVGELFSKHPDGMINVEIPYSIIDAQGNTTDSVFRSGNIHPYKNNKVFVLPFGLEVGRLNSFFTVNFAISLIGGWSNGFTLSAGYGRNFYIGDLVIKPSINIAYTDDAGADRSAYLGRIDNRNKTINILGKTAGPSYDHTTDYELYSVTKTYNAGAVDLYYAQHEWAFMPKITITTNQYHGHARWDLTVGCNFPFSEKAGIALDQDGESDHSKPVEGFTNIRSGAFTTRYNNQVIHSAPFRFPGLFISVAVSGLFHKKA